MAWQNWSSRPNTSITIWALSAITSIGSDYPRVRQRHFQRGKSIHDAIQWQYRPPRCEFAFLETRDAAQKPRGNVPGFSFW